MPPEARPSIMSSSRTHLAPHSLYPASEPRPATKVFWSFVSNTTGCGSMSPRLQDCVHTHATHYKAYLLPSLPPSPHSPSLTICLVHFFRPPASSSGNLSRQPSAHRCRPVSLSEEVSLANTTSKPAKMKFTAPLVLSALTIAASSPTIVAAPFPQDSAQTGGDATPRMMTSPDPSGDAMSPRSRHVERFVPGPPTSPLARKRSGIAARQEGKQYDIRLGYRLSQNIRLTWNE